jgi:hypothetical protein
MNTKTINLSIDVSAAGPVISPLLFGHNLEVTRRAVWSGIGAEMVANRKFAAVENGFPKRWYRIVGCGTAVLDEQAPSVGRHAVRLGDEGVGGIGQQQDCLAFREGTEYAFRLRLRSVEPRVIRILIEGGRGGSPVFQRAAGLKPGGWQVLEGRFVSPATVENARLEIASDTPGVFWLGTASLQPADAFHGMRRDVIGLLKRIKPGCLRYPGGCYAEFYPWQEGLLPVDERPPIGPVPLDFLLPHTDDFDTHEIGIDEFMALCREVGCEPAITARLSETTPDDTAAWVEYCNGGPGTKWGGIRARRGHPEPYNVRYWFVGNELYSFGRGLAKGAEGCAAQSRLFAEAMKKADPTIRLVACTNYIPFIETPDWNRQLLPAGGGLFDCCSVHDYVLGHVPLKTDDDMGTVARAPTQEILSILKSARQHMDREAGSSRRVGMAFDEWNTYWGRTGSVCMGVYVAGFLNLLCRESENLGIEMGNYFQPITEGAIAVTPLTACLDTAGYVFKLYELHQGAQLLKTPDLPADGDIDVCASLDPRFGRVCLTLVNRSIATDHVVALDLGIAHERVAASARFLVARDVTREQAIFDERSETLAVAAGRVSVRLPRYSIARVELTFARDQA